MIAQFQGLPMIVKRRPAVKHIATLWILIIATFLPAPAAEAQTLDDKIDQALAFSQLQLDRLARRKGDQRFVAYTDRDGKWIGRNVSDWCCAFTPGLMWMMYDYTGDAKWEAYGRDWTEAVRQRATATDNDTGFQIFCAYGYGLRHAPGETKGRGYESVIRQASETLTSQRYNANVGAYRTWPPQLTEPYVGKFEVNSDMIMNLELPIHVAVSTNDHDLLDKVMRHQETTWQHTIFKTGDMQWVQPGSPEYVERKHGSHWHVVDFDPTNGNVIHKRQYQGDRDESTWSRGQAWLIYGYAMLYRYTGNELMLDRAGVCFDYYMAALEAQSNDSIPYSDFDAPLEKTHPRDSSAAAIVASAAIELYESTGDKKYLNAAEEMLGDLTSPPYLAEDTEYESILTRASYMFDDQKEIGAIFGDFYFVEAMLRYKKLMARDR